jgi:two-component system response regulator AtoC
MTPSARIAIVDDDPEYAAVLEQMLGCHGYDVVLYESGAAFLAGLGQPPVPDVVLLDMVMPGLDGLGTLKRARMQLPDLPVIMVSGQQKPANIVDSVRAGALDYIVKSASAASNPAALEGAIRGALEKRALSSEVATLKAKMSDDPSDRLQPCWSNSSSMKPVLTMVERVADSDVPVLITGESGVGKEVIAKELHRQSPRRNRPFVKVNCAALPLELLESELFGHERGAFTGAHAPRAGKFEFADGGTLMLDEIGEMPPLLQAKLLHVLQDHAVTKLGSNRAIPVDVRVIAATNRPLQTLLRNGQFRADLYYRLQVIQIHVPPLRERRSEVIPLVEYFLKTYAVRYKHRPVAVSDAMRDAFLTYPWPGNIRELENVVKRFVILQDEKLVLSELQQSGPITLTETEIGSTAVPPLNNGFDSNEAPEDDEPEPGSKSLLQLARDAAMAAERSAILRALVAFRWNRRRAAKQLGVSYKTLLNKMKECGITNDQGPEAGTS